MSLTICNTCKGIKGLTNPNHNDFTTIPCTCPLEEKSMNDTRLTKEKASIILEDVIDTLIEVGNGVTDEMLHDAADDLIRFRDQWFNKIEVWVEQGELAK